MEIDRLNQLLRDTNEIPFNIPQFAGSINEDLESFFTKFEKFCHNNNKTHDY